MDDALSSRIPRIAQLHGLHLHGEEVELELQLDARVMEVERYRYRSSRSDSDSDPDSDDYSTAHGGVHSEAMRLQPTERGGTAERAVCLLVCLCTVWYSTVQYEWMGCRPSW